MNLFYENTDKIISEYFENKEISYEEEILNNNIIKYEIQLKSHLSPDNLIIFEKIKIEQLKLQNFQFQKFINYLITQKK